MIRKTFLFLLVLFLSVDLCRSQAFIRTIDLFQRPDGAGKLNIIQNQAVDTLLSRYILSNRKLKTGDGKQGMQGFRIQIYFSSVRNAREESAKARAEFLSKFPDIFPYAEFQEPGYYMVRAGDYRTKTECYKYLLMVRKEFPDAYPVPATINFPDLIKK
jgi:hypothetical protein